MRGIDHPRTWGPRRRRTTLLVAGLLAVTVPVYVTTFYVGLLTRVLVFAAFATAYNFAFGYADLPAFGPAVFYGIGAYGFVLTLDAFPGSVLLPVAVTLTVAVGYSLFVGAVSTRGSGIYFALLTFAFAQFVYEIGLRATDLTGGTSGRIVDAGNLPFGRTFLRTDVVYLLALVVLVGFVLLVRHLVRSPFGKVVQAVASNEARAQSLGYPVRRVKIAVFVVSMTLCSVPGFLVAVDNQFVSTAALHFEVSLEVILVALLGGTGTLLGPIVGAVVFVGLTHLTKDFANVGTLLTGATLILLMLRLPEGVVGAVVGSSD
jgi:branched-chain amino acid transport system permease protein